MSLFNKTILVGTAVHKHHVDVTSIHALTKEIAHGFARPMAPVGSYILGLAIGARAATGAPVDPDALSAAIRATFPSAT